MEVKVYNNQGSEVGVMELPDAVFNVPMKDELVHQVLLAQQSNARQGSAHSKDRGAVRGGGKKPWRQKGTGRARHASIRSPLWRGGGVTFGPLNVRNYSKQVNKKMRRKALFMVLSSKIAGKQSVVVDTIAFEVPKTKEALAIVRALRVVLAKDAPNRGSLLIVTPKKDRVLEKSVQNLSTVATLPANSLNVGALLSYKYVAMLRDAIPVIEKTYET